MSRPDDIGIGRYPQKVRDSVLLRARAVGIAGDVESMQLALAAMIGGYDRMLATTPKQTHPVIEGAFGKSVVIARQILEAV